MDASTGIKQTTQGIWMANCPGIDPHTLIMDVEGNDGQERGEDDTMFERQSALFALVVSNIVIVNMWYSDLGREQGANKPLLRVVFQAMVTMFKTNKVTLMFLIRDANVEAPLSFLVAEVKKTIQEIWEPIAPEKAPLSDFFNVQVASLPHLKLQKDQFVEDVANLRKQFFNSISPGGLASDKKSFIPASGFSCSAMTLWETIKENNDLDIPSHKVLVATVFCEKIAEEKFTWFFQNESWHQVQKSVQDGDIKGFGDKVNSLLNTCLAEYNERTKFYDDSVRETKQMTLKARVLQLIQPVWNSVVDHMGLTTLEMFKKEIDEAVQNGKYPSEAASVCNDSFNVRFDEGCADADVTLANWDISAVKAELISHVVNHVIFVTNKVAQLKADHEAAERQLEHDTELIAAQEAAQESARVAAEYKATERQLEHEMKVIAAQGAARVALEFDATERQLRREMKLIAAEVASGVVAEYVESKRQLKDVTKLAAAQEEAREAAAQESARVAAERQLEHEMELVAAQEATRVAAELDATQRQLEHEMQLAAAEAAAYAAAKEAAEGEVARKLAVSRLKAFEDAAEQKERQIEAARLKAEEDSFEAKKLAEGRKGYLRFW